MQKKTKKIKNVIKKKQEIFPLKSILRYKFDGNVQCKQAAVVAVLTLSAKHRILRFVFKNLSRNSQKGINEKKT